MLLRILLALKTAPQRGRLRRLLEGPDRIIESTSRSRDLWGDVSREPRDLIIVSEVCLPRPQEGFISSVRDLPDPPEIIILTGKEDAESRARFLAAGSSVVLTTKLSNRTLGEVLERILEERQAESVSRALQEQAPGRPSLSSFVSRSPTMGIFLKTVQRVVPSDTTLLITGETGVGKEWLARTIHAEGPRSEGPFVAVHCGALPESLLESELFGHEEGAFTGASRSRRGWFELAHGGVIFLDEIGEMPLHLQVKLLRVLQSREVQRIGGEKTIPVDVRLMAATNRDLEAAVNDGSFRKDLFYRLSVVALELPPLRERAEDISELVENYVDHYRGQIGSVVEGVDDRAMTALQGYSWPGNIRELMNVIERAVLLCEETLISPGDLPAEIGAQGSHSIPAGGALWTGEPDLEALTPSWLDTPLDRLRAEVVAGLERSYLESHLAASHGRIDRTAERAGILPRTLHRLMKKHGLEKEDYKG